ncbi:hypothetical protein [Flavobacterium sp.]|jgi:hypothetical protein|uniref:hypothetical protein n=1 Tax=Flavobacterium sp. TaxID=239 RepID=UPI0037C111B5
MIKKLLLLFLVFALISCKTNTYIFVDSKTPYSVDFSNGKWLLNEIDCPTDNKDPLTTQTIDFFSKKVGQRFSYIKNEKGLLIAQKSYFQATKSVLKDLKKGTDFDYLLNIVAKKNRSDMAGLQLYQKEVPGTNESEVFLEIVDLNTQEVIFSEHVIGKFQKNTQKSIWDDPNTKKSTNVIDNININKTSNTLLIGCLGKILDKLGKT